MLEFCKIRKLRFFRITRTFSQYYKLVVEKMIYRKLQSGSGKDDLQKLACDINRVFELHGIEICPEWIPRGLMTEADVEVMTMSVSQEFFFRR